MSFAFSNPYQAVPPAPVSDQIFAGQINVGAGAISVQVLIPKPGAGQRIRLFNIVVIPTGANLVSCGVFESSTMALDGSGLLRSVFSSAPAGALATPTPVVYPSNGFPCTPDRGLVVRIDNGAAAGPSATFWTVPYSVE